MAKVKLHQLVRELEADINERTDKDEANAQLCWFGYLEKTALAYVAAEYAARGEWEVDEDEFMREFVHLALQLDSYRESRPKRIDAGGCVKRQLPYHIVRTLRERFHGTNADGDPVH